MQAAVRLPRLLGSDFVEARRVHPTSLSLELQRRSCSTGELVLPEEEARLPLLSFLELFTAKGSAGLYRVAGTSEPVSGTRTYSLRHAIDTLRDSRWKAQDYDFSGTMQAFLTALLAQQSTVLWQLGTCADTGNWYRSGINYDSLDELLDEVRADRNGYIFTYDFTTTPWTLNFVQVSGDTVDCELRQTRNLSDGQLRRTRDGMCNILYLSVSTTTDHETAVTYQTYQDAASIAQFGPIEGTANVDTADVPDPAAWAAKFLQDHAWPIAQASADGFELVKTTGEAWDALDIGKTARLAVTRDGFPAVFPIETLRYEQLCGETPEKVRAELNRPLPRFSASLAQARETARRAYGASRTNKKALKENEHFQHMSKATKEGMEDCFGVIGVKLDPETHEPLRDAQGNYIWAGPNDAAAEIWGHLHRNAWETQILNHIKDADGNVLSLAEVHTDAYGNAIINAINDQRTGTATINANRIKLKATDTITLDAKLSIDANTNRLDVTGDLDIGSDAYIHGDVFVDGVIEMFDTFMSDSESFQAVTARFGASGSGVSQRILGHGSLLVGLDATENADGTITISFADNSLGGHDSANFRIAATNKYINGVAAAYTNAVNRVSWPTTPRTQSSFSVSVPGNPWNASTETGTTLNRIFALSAGSFDSNHISTVELAMSHNENGQAVADGVVAKIDVDASGVYSAGDSAGYSRGYSKGMDDVGVYITKNGSWYTSWTIQAGDSETFYPAKWINGSYVVDYNRGLTVTASGGGTDSSNIDLANAGQIWLHSSDPGSGYVNLGSLGSRITEGKNNGSAYVSFQATCDGGTTYKYYKIPL